MIEQILYIQDISKKEILKAYKTNKLKSPNKS